MRNTVFLNILCLPKMDREDLRCDGYKITILLSVLFELSSGYIRIILESFLQSHTEFSDFPLHFVTNAIYKYYKQPL